MFYIMSDDDRIIEQYNSCPTLDDLEELANECHLHYLWVIRGEHSGITWTRPENEPEPAPKPRLVFGQPIPDELLPKKPRQAPFSLWSDK